MCGVGQFPAGSAFFLHVAPVHGADSPGLIARGCQPLFLPPVDINAEKHYPRGRLGSGSWLPGFAAYA